MTDEEKLAYMRKIMNDEEYEQLLIDYHKRLEFDKMFKRNMEELDEFIRERNVNENRS